MFARSMFKSNRDLLFNRQMNIFGILHHERVAARKTYQIHPQRSESVKTVFCFFQEK